MLLSAHGDVIFRRTKGEFGGGDMGEIWKELVKQFWFLRGIAAAITLAEVVPRITDLSRFEFLRAFHALLVGWREVAGWIGSALGKLPLIPHISADVVNGAVFTASVGVPAGFALIRLGNSQSAVNRLDEFGIPRWSLWGFGATVPFFLYGIYMTATVPGYLETWQGRAEEQGEILSLVEVSILSLFVLAAFLCALITLKGYARGLIVFVSFVITLQLLYWINTPWLADFIRSISTNTA